MIDMANGLVGWRNCEVLIMDRRNNVEASQTRNIGM